MATLCEHSSPFYHWQQKQMVKRILAADPEQLLSAGRTLLARRPGFDGEISPSSPEIPIAICRLKPTKVSMSANALGVDFSDASNPFGIIVYAAGVHPPVKVNTGIGPREWIDGLWLYDDGQLEKYVLKDSN
jgi:hypothetical protein